MKKLFALLFALVAVFAVAGCTQTTTKEQLDGSDKFVAVVTDVGQLMDGGFNQGTYEGAMAFARETGALCAYYAPANGANATDADRIAAMELAIEEGANVIVAPGFLQATALTTTAAAHRDVKFVFVDGWATGDANITAIVYKEQESGYFAGYAAVMEGFTKLGATLGGGGTNPACCRFGYGYIQGANDAAKALGKTVEMKVSFKYGSSFSASNELQTQIAGWYAGGTEVVFSCGGSMVNSVIAAAGEQSGKYIIGVDTDQSVLSTKIITSATKGLASSVKLVLEQWLRGEWDTKLSNKASNLGAAEDATGLPTATWRFQNYTKEQYAELFNKVKNGQVVPAAEYPTDAQGNCDFSSLSLSNITVDFQK